MATIASFPSLSSSPRSSRFHTRDWWRRFIGDWPGSGLTQAEYCRRHGVRLGSFSWWRFRVRQERDSVTPKRDGVSGFLPVRIVPPAANKSTSLPASSSAAPVEIVLSGDRLVRVYPESDLSFVRRVVEALESPSC